MTAAVQTIGFSLSQQQRHLWRVYEQTRWEQRLIRGWLRLEGPLDIAVLEAGLRNIVSRHEVLRTRLETLPGMMLPVQTVSEAMPVISFHDMTKTAAGTSLQACSRVLEEFENQPSFRDLGGSQIRAELIRFAAESHYLLIAISPFCGDRKSLHNVLLELASEYSAQAQTAPAQAQDPLQYADYAAWQEEVLSGDMGDAARYWKHHKQQAQPAQLAFERQPDDRAIPGPAILTLPLPKDVFGAVTDFAHRHEVTVESVLLAAWAALLHRHTGRSEIEVAYLCDGRSEPVAAAMGAFARFLPLRCAIDSGQTFSALAGRLHGTLEEHRDWQDYFDVAGAAPDEEGGEGRGQALPFGFGFASVLPTQCARLVLMTLERVTAVVEPLRLHLQCLVEQDGLAAELHYDRTRFAQSAVECLAEQWLTLLADAVRKPKERVNRLSLLSAGEREQVIASASLAASAASLEVSGLHELLERQAKTSPQALALRHGEASWTYAELNQRAGSLASRLRMEGLRTEDRVGILIQNPLQMVAAIFAVLKAGGAYVPLDPAQPSERLDWMIHDAAVTLILTEASLADIAKKVAPRAIYVNGRLDPEPDGVAAAPALDRTLPDQLAYVIYTSGSTGHPKGVAVSHRTALHSTLSRHSYYRAPVRGFLLLSSFSFDSSVAGLFWTLSQGGCLCIPTTEEMQDPVALALLIEHHELSHLLCLPSLYAVLIEQPCQRFRSLQVAIIAGESCSPRLPALHDERLPATQLYNEYGPTEATVWSTVLDVMSRPTQQPASIGRPIEGARVYLLDEQQGLVPRGITGEIYIGGAGIARGYLRSPGMTAERFLPDPFGPPGSRLYRTGDLARWNLDCELEFLGRADQQVKIRGYRIELGEIEARLSVISGVDDCAVVMREDSPGDKRLVAYVVPRAADLDLEGLRAQLRQALPDYMIPSMFVTLEYLPRNSNGKLDRARLRTPDANRAKHRALSGPRNDTERVLAEIWQQLLRIDSVSIEDNFFELGGDSILSIQMVGRARQRGLSVTARQLFEHQTIAALAAVVAPVPQTQCVPIVGAEIPLTPIQRWFFDLNYDNPERWAHALVLAMRDPFEPAAMDLALAAVLRHHDELRICFSRGEDGWHQAVAAEPLRPSVARIKLPCLSEAEQLAELRHLASQSAEIDLQSGQMLKLIWAEAPGEGRGYLVAVMSHLVSDGISWRIILEDLELSYRQAVSQKQIALPPRTSSFAEWAHGLKGYAQSQSVQAQADYWMSLLQNPITALPVDEPEGDRREQTSASLQTVCDETVTGALLQRAVPAYRAGIEDFVLTALALTLARWVGDTRVLIDLDRHGREPILPEVDLTRTLGWFTSVSPHVLRVDPKASLVANLKTIKEQLWQAPHRGLHYGLLRYLDQSNEIAPKLRKLPQAQILFNYMGQLDPSVGGGKLFSLVDGEVLGGRDPNWQRPYEIAVNADILGHRLRITWDYSSARYHRSTIETLAQRCAETLQTLVANCLLADTGGYTPSDFPLARLGQKQCDQLFGEVRGIEDVYPLTPLQQGILFHALYAPGSGTYVEQLSCTLEGPLDVAAFAAAWRQVVGSHPILRSSFLWEGLDSPLQVVHANVVLPIEEQDWRGLAPSQQTRRWAAYLEADRQSGFDFSRAPLMRLALMRCGETRWFFLWSHHHVLLDGWSGPLVLQDAFAVYNALGHGNAPRLTARRPFRDYLEWLAGRSMETAETYWRRTLAGFHACTPLPFQLRPESGSLCANGPFAESRFALSVEKTRALEEFARREKVTLNTLVQGAWAILLGRCSGERDVLFGVTVSGRPAELAGAEAMVGLFINTLPLRVDLPPEARVADWLRRLLQANMELREHEHAALVDVQSWSELPRGKALFECLLAFENYPVDEALRAQQGSISAQDVRFIEQTHYSLTIVAFPGPQLVFNVNYDCLRFDEETIARMAKHFSSLLAGIISFPAVRLGELSLLGSEEWHRQVVEWNGRADCGAGSCIHELFEEQARRTPEAIALVFGDERLSYGELNAKANQLAHHLRSLGAGPERVIGICAERSLEMVVGILAILKSGGAYLPLDPAYPAERLAFMIEDAGAALVLTQENLFGSLPQLASTICLDRDRALWASAPKAGLEPLGGPANLAYIIYTSGSTGRPKGVMVTHSNVTRLFAATQAEFGFGEGDVWSLFHSCAFDFSVWEMWGALLHGGTLVVVPYWVSRAPDDFYDLLVKEQVTVLNQTPGAFGQLLQTPAFLAGRGPLALRLVIFGGEALDPQSLRPWLERYGEAHPRLVNMYGITETTVHVTVSDQGFAELGAKKSIIGRPLCDRQTYILDAYLQPVPVGVQGELYVGGGGLSRGYVGRPGLAAERFIPNPFGGESSSGGERLYRTGDLACHRADGTIEYLGRIDHQVKIRGHRIELGEIEACLAAHPAVREAAVIVREDRPADKRLVAYVAAKEGAALAAVELRAALERRLPAYMVPSAFVSLDRLPLTINGKVHREALLASHFSEPLQGAYAGPQNSTQEVLCRNFAETLRLERVGIYDNFFELGGHSLLAVTLIDRIRQEGLQADIRSLFLSPTPAGLAVLMRDGDEFAIPPNLIPPGCKVIRPEMLPLVELSQADIDSVVATVPGGTSNVQDIYPLAPLQEGILFHHLMSEKGDPYLLPTLLAFDTAERLERFLEALRAVIARHDILRSAILWEGLPEPVQVVLRTAPLVVEEVLLDPERDTADQLRARYDPQDYRLDIRKAPLLRGFTAHDAATGRRLLLLLAHHLVCDHTTLEILVEEVRLHLLGRMERLQQPVPFRNFVAHTRLGVNRSDQEAFFREMLGDVAEPTAPFGLLDIRSGAAGIGEAQLDLEPGLACRIRAQARTLRVSPACLFHQAFALVLARVSGRSDVVFGTVLLGRMHGSEGTHRGLGMYINTLPLRVKADEEPVMESVRRTHRLLTELLRHEHASIALAQKCSAVHAPAPLFSALLNYRYSLASKETSGEAAPVWEGTELIFSNERTNYPFDLSVDDLDQGFRLTAHAQGPVDPQRMCLFMRIAIERLVDALESSPDTAMQAIDILPDAERRQLLIEWNTTAAAYPSERCIHELFEEQARRTPEAIALVFGDERLSYGELNAKANQLAHHLRSLGAGPERVIGICAERSLEMVVGILAILKSGGAYLPLDPAYPAERLAFMIEDAGAALVLTQENLFGSLPQLASTICLDRDRALWASAPKAGLEPLGGPANLAYIIYTSGSTGRPKGVAIIHRNTVAMLHWAALTFTTESIAGVLAATSVNFDLSVFELFAPLCAGGKVILINAILELPRQGLAEEVTLINTVPSAMAELLRHEGLPPSVRTVNLAGEPLPQSLAQALNRCRGLETVFNLYGPSECTTYSSFALVHRDDRRTPPIGRPISNTQIYIVDERMRPVPVGVAGELCIGGVGVSRGYLGRPGLTAERFVPNPFVSEDGAGERLYRTGDLACHRADGTIEYLGRIDHQVKIRGFRIELGEIEARLMEHPQVQAAAAAVVGENKQLIAYFVPDPCVQPRPEELSLWLSERLPPYMVPTDFVQLASLPLTANGKLDRKRLPAPDPANNRLPFTGPRNAAEEILVGIWEEVLGQTPISINANFFEMGGHSLLATQVVSRIRKAFQVDLSVRALFEAQTPEALAQRVRAREIGGQAQQPPRDLNLSVRPRSIPTPLSFAQQRLWFLDRLEPQSPLYNMPLGLRLAGRLDVLALKNALNDVIRRHEVLRTCFPLVDGHPVQSIAQTLTINLPVIRLIDMAAQDQPAELRRLASVEAGKPFDLGAGPLIRGCIFQTRHPGEDGRGEHVLLLTLHHSIADGWSRGILVRELAERYENFASSQGRFLNDLTIQYADYTLWQHEYLAGEELNRQLTYWRNRLSDVPELLQLPADQPRPKAQSYAGDSFSVRIPQTVIGKLRALARRNGATLFMVLLAAFKLLLSRYSGQKDICVGTPVANRPLVEFEALIGCFVNTLVLRTNLAGNPRFTELLARVRTATLEAQEHQDLPFERLVTELGLERDIGRNPLFQVSFSLDNTPQPRFELKELSIEAFEIETATAMFDLAVDVTDTGDGLLAVFEFSTDLFSRRTIEKLAAHYLALLDSAVIYPDARISELVMLTEPERRFLLGAGDGPVESGRQAPDAYSPVSVVTLIEESVARFAKRTALLEGDTRLTYREINIRANRLAHRLIQLGVRPEAAVGIYAERSAGLVIAIVAVLKAGGAYVPLDPHYPSQRLRAMVEDSAPAIVLAQAGFPDELAAGLTVLNLNDDDCLAYPETNPAIPIDGNNLAYILFTSGSTGRPKGVAVPHRALANRVLWGISEFNISPNDVTLQLTSPSFDVSAWEICGSLSAGACLVIAGPTAADPAHLIELVQLHCITVIEVVPSLLLALMRTAGWSKCPTLRLVCCGGEAMNDALRAEFVTSLPGCRLLNMYGPTETTIDASYFACDVLEGSHTNTGTFVPLGKPIRGACLYVLDRHLNLVPTGVIGELFIGGAGLARGYYHQPGLTAEHFIPDPFRDEGGRLYRTGDLARWRDDGVLKFCGRTDHQVKLRGLRIELEEIEACLEQYSGVTAVAVAVQRDCKGTSRLAAYVESKDATVTPALLRSYARTVLPAFMVPSLWSLIAELPRDENGKLRRSSLPPVAAATDRGGSAGKADDDPLLTETEETLARIWADVLGLPSVGRHDGFFDLGGHSLLAVQLTQKMREALQADIPLVALFQFPTIAALAEWLQSQHNVVLSPLVKVHEGARERSPLYLLHTGVGHIRGYQPLIAALDPAYPIYGIQMRAAGNPAVEAHDYESVISDYIEVIRPHHPGSSYRLLGWSHGGLIAIGMAARLSELGADVSFVGLMDTDLPRELNIADWKGRLVEFLKDPEDQARLAALPDHERTELEQLLSDVAPAERPAAAALWGREKGLWFNHVSLEALRLETSLWRHISAIEDTFKPPRFTGDLHVWWAKASLMKGEVPAVDWAKISGAKTHEMIIDADHHSIIASPDLHASIRQVFQGLDP